ncbi:MAG: VanW family protein [Myxococcota bacterium]|nr:VanW family protein [Myxococcota bacterium]
MTDISSLTQLVRTQHYMLQVVSLLLWLLSVVSFTGCTSLVRSPHSAEPSSRRSVEPTWVPVGSFSTTFDVAAVDRSYNLRLAARLVDGVVVASGERFSFNHEVGRRTLERGFRVAPVLAFEGKRPAMGGGICQVSTTIYNAALYADLRILHRYPHSRPIRYVPLGRDATVSWGSKDLTFENPHPHPIRLSASTQHGRLVVTISAPDALSYEVRLETADHEQATPRKQLQVNEQSERLSIGGVWVKLYRHRVVDGSVVATERIGGASFYPFRRRLEAP